MPGSEQARPGAGVGEIISVAALCTALVIGVVWIAGVLPDVVGMALFPATVIVGIVAGIVDDRIG